MNELRTTLRDDLIAAKALIVDPAMWVKNPGAIGESYCAVTSLTGLFHGMPPDIVRDRKRAAWDALASALPDGWVRVGEFNDDPDTTHADVMALFDRAISKASVQS